jgi:GNAT superfamily N-acetyltransferase
MSSDRTAEASHAPEPDVQMADVVVPTLRRATLGDVGTIVRILIASKEASFPGAIDDHDRDVEFWTRRWRDYVVRGSIPLQLFGDGWVYLAEVEGCPVAYVAYHHTKRLGTDAELQNIYVLKEWQRKGIGSHLLGVVAHRLLADGSRTMCVGFDSDSPYKHFYMKLGAIETEPGAPWAIWSAVGDLAARLPRPADELLIDVERRPSRSWTGWLGRRR